MLRKLTEHSLETAALFAAESMSLNLSEMDSTATLTLGPDAPALAQGDWVQDLDAPGAGIVWRVRSVDTQYNTETRTVNLEQMINTLADRIIPDEVKAEDLSGSDTCTAWQAVSYILSLQQDWQLGDFEYPDRAPYKFDGETLKAALQTVLGSLEDSILEYDYRKYPFRLHVRKLPETVDSEMRAGRNITTMKYTVDRTRMYTRFYPVGKNDLRLGGNGYVERNTGKYGIIEKTETNSGAETEAELQSWSMIRLKKHAEPIVTVMISGLDLSAATGEAMDSFAIGHKCRVAIPAEGLVIIEKVTKLAWRDKIKEPENVTVTLANTLEDVSTILREEQATSSGSRRSAAKNDKEKLTTIGQVEEGLYTVIAQTADQIRMEAHDEAQGLAAQLEITASRIQSELTDSKNDLLSRITQIAEMIRMEVQNTANEFGSSITQTAESIISEVHNTRDGLQSQITQTADKISLKVSKGDVATELSVEMGNVKVKNGNLIVDGMVTADAVKAAIAKIDHLQVYGTITAYTIKMKAGTTEKNVWSAIEDLKYDRTVGNTVYLKYTKFNGIEGEVSFSKAALLKGTWSGGTYTAGPNSDGSSTIVATQLHNNPYKLTYWPLLNTYTVEVGYMQGGVLKSTGGNLSFIAEDAYKAGQDSVQIPHPTYSGSWDGGTYVVKADGVSVQSTSLGSVEIPEEGSEDIRWIGTTKWLSVPVVIKDTLTRDTGYHPQLNIPAGKAYDAGWKGYHDSNKFGMDVAANASIKNVYRPGATPGSSAETWFKLRVQAEWATQPGTTNITDTNTVTWNAQRRLIGSNDWDNMVSVPSILTLFQSGGFVYARVGAQNVAKVSVTPSISVSDWAFIAGYADASGLKKASEAKARFSVKTKVNGTDYSSVIATNYAFKLGKQTDPKYAVLYYGSTAIAWLKQPDPVVDDWHIGDGYADKDDGLKKTSSAKARFAISATVNGNSVSKVVSTGKKFSLGKLINDNDYASLLYGSTAIAWLKMPERETPAPPEPTVSGFFASTGYAPSSGLEPLNSSKIRLNVGVSVNGVQKSAIVTTGSAFSLGNNFRTGYVTLYYGSTAVAWLKLPG